MFRRNPDPATAASRPGLAVVARRNGNGGYLARRKKPAGAGRNPFDPLDGRADHQLDLHSFGAVAAGERLRSHVLHLRQRSPGTLLHVITGKGRNSPGPPVLKPLVRTLLKGELSPHIAAWSLDDDEGGYLIRLK